MWPFSYLKAKADVGVDLEEARATGQMPPEDWRAPGRAGLGAALRTGAAAARSAPLAVIGMVLGARKRPFDAEAQYASARSWAARTLAWLKVSLDVLFAERVPADSGLIFMWNQESHLDHLVLPAAIERPFITVYNNAVSQTPLYGRYLAATGNVHIDRHDERQWRAALAAAAHRIREGECLLISPEGTRSWDGELLRMKRGAFILARQAARPIVCVTVIGGHDRLPRGAAAVRPGPMRVVFSEPLLPSTDWDEPGGLEASVAETFRRAKAEHAL